MKLAWITRLVVAALAVALLAAPAGAGGGILDDLAAPDGKTPKSITSFVGTNADGSIGVAVVHRGKQAAAYVCDGDQIGSWYTGQKRGSKLTLKNDDGERFTATIRGSTVRGAVTAEGQDLDFTLERAKSYAGLYRAADGKVLAGWVIQNNGTVYGEIVGGTITLSAQLDINTILASASIVPEVTEAQALPGFPTNVSVRSSGPVCQKLLFNAIDNKRDLSRPLTTAAADLATKQLRIRLGLMALLNCEDQDLVG
jgi:hypothetical protein